MALQTKSKLSRTIARCALVALAAASMAGCTSSPYDTITVAQANAAVTSGHMLTPGDSVRINVFDEPNLSGDFQIDNDGTLSMPLIRPISTKGMTPQMLSERIAQALTEGGYVLSPRVAIDVMNYRPIYVLGEVATPGEYPYAADMTHLQAIAKAGGFTARADKNALILNRTGWDEPRELRLSTQPLLIQPGDTIMVREAFF
jgi:polysaccharide export outer membrane protein